MRAAPGFIALALCALCTTSAWGATVVSPAPAMHIMLPPAQLTCPAVAGNGITVTISGIPPFPALTVASERGSRVSTGSETTTSVNREVSHEQLGAIVVTKQVDAASPKLLRLVQYPTLIPAVTIVFHRGASASEYLMWSLASARVLDIVHVQPQGSNTQRGEPASTERITIDYERITSKVCSGNPR